jgi:uncharacterized repeat protein (TIGR03803 family)
MKTERESKAIGLVRLGILGIFLANAGPLRGQSPSYAGIYIGQTSDAVGGFALFVDTNQNAVLIGGYLYNDDDGTAFYGSCVVDAGGNGYSDIANVTTSFTISAAGSVSLTASADDSSFSYQMQGFKVLSGPFLSTAGLYTLDLGAGQTLTAIVAANGWIYRDSPSYGGGGRVQVTGYGQSATESSLGHSVNTFILNQNGTLTLNGSSTMNRVDSLPAPPVMQGAVLTTLHSFGVFMNGRTPTAALVEGSDGNFYGTTAYGGPYGSLSYGTVFRISAAGELTNLYSFTGGKDGSNPYAGLVQGSDGNFYGTTSGFDGGYGTVFRISDSGVFASLYSFTNGNDGAEPVAGLVPGNDGYFYGTTSRGANGYGTVFKISPGGSLTSLYAFTGGKDGAEPVAGLSLGGDGYFYGTTFGGTNGYGTVFRISDSGVFASLYSFTNGNDGAYPVAGLVPGNDGYFYGTTRGGAKGYGTVFKISSGGSLTSLYAFTNGNDGAEPEAGLVLGSDGSFYGTTRAGANYYGTVFKISPSGSLTSLYAFTDSDDGADPEAGLLLGKDGNFYGTTTFFGDEGSGTVFKVSPSGSLTTLYFFSDYGEVPEAALVQGSDSNFYGTTTFGVNGYGTVFKISASGAFASLYSFTNGDDGAYPEAALVQGGDGNFYGTTSGDSTGSGPSIYGTVFKINVGGALTNLYLFSSGNDGNNPEGGLVQGSDGNFYGTTFSTAANATQGTVFELSDSGAFTILQSLTASGVDGVGINRLVQGGDGNFYGTTYGGGAYGGFGYGTVFKISANGALTSLYSFTGGNDGAFPRAALVQGSDGYFYGTTYDGGTSSNGTVFKISNTGALTSLYSFTDGNDGANPKAALVQGSDGYFYGTTSDGASGYGTVFKISASGTFTSLYSFTNGNDGGNPEAALVQGSDSTFYGTTSGGGLGGWGTVFQMTVGASGITNCAISVSVSPTNGGSVSGGGAFPSGSTQTVAASANGGYAFVDWTENGAVVSSSANYTFTLNSNVSLVANFTTMPSNAATLFGPQVQSTPSASITYNSETGAFQYTGPADLSDDHAYLPLAGAAAALITTSNAWSVSLAVNLSARSLTSTATKTPNAAIGLYILDSNNIGKNIGIQLAQANNAGQSVSSDVPSDFYGALAKFTARPNGDPPADTTTLGTSEHLTNGASDQIISGGTNDSPATELIGAVNGVLALAFNPSTETITGYFNGSPVGSYSLAIWGHNPPLTLVVAGFSEEGAGVPAGTATASGFSVATEPWVGADDFSSGISANWTVYQQNYGQMLAVGTNQHLSFIVGASTSSEQNAEVVWNGTPDVTSDWTMDITGHNSATWSANGASQLQLWVVNSANTATGYRIAMAGGSDQASEYVFNTKTPSSGSRQNVPATNADFGLRLVHRGGVSGDIEAWYDPTGNGVAWTLLDTISMAAFWPGVVAGDTFTVAIVADTYYGPIAEGQLWADNFRITNSAIAPSAPVALEIATTNAAFGFTNGVFGFSISGPAGSNVVIEVSADLKTWIPLQTNVFGSAPLYYSDSQSPTNRQRFYRAELLP